MIINRNIQIFSARKKNPSVLYTIYFQAVENNSISFQLKFQNKYPNKFCSFVVVVSVNVHQFREKKRLNNVKRCLISSSISLFQ